MELGVRLEESHEMWCVTHAVFRVRYEFPCIGWFRSCPCRDEPVRLMALLDLNSIGGYSFYGDCLMHLDKVNGTKAARLASAFTGWTAYDAHRAVDYFKLSSTR